MKMVTLKEFALNHHISYEAVRKSVVRYRDELEGHIITEKGSKRQYLDEEAQRILSDHRKQNPITIIRENHSDKLTEQAAEIETLKKRIDFYRDELIQLQKQQIVLLENKHQYEAFLEDRDRLQAEHDQAIADRETAEAAAKTAQAEVETVRAAAETAKAQAAAAETDAETARAEAAAAQADRNRIEEERNVIQSDRDQARKELSTAKTIIRTAEGTCERLEKERDSAQAAYSRLEEERDQLRTELQSVQTAKEEAQAEANRYHKSWFGFYRKR